MKPFYRFLIRQYQTRISPHKGYRCAYSLEHGGPGCSGAVLGILEHNGLIRGWSQIQGRFDGCSNAAEQRKKRKDEKKKTGSCSKGDCGYAEACDAGVDIISCGGGKGGKGGKGCDTPSCDIPSCDAPSCSMVLISLGVGMLKAMTKR